MVSVIEIENIADLQAEWYLEVGGGSPDSAARLYRLLLGYDPPVIYHLAHAWRCRLRAGWKEVRMGNCERYWKMLAEWTRESREQSVLNQAAVKRTEQALTRLRIHMMACRQCQDAFWSCFPETMGKRRESVPLVDMQVEFTE